MRSKQTFTMSKHPLLWSGVHVFSTVSSIIVNKYILSILGFTYPTIFQSWQMVCICVVLLTSLVFELIKQPIITSTVACVMVPQSILFTIGIYSGSVALSQLPVPLVCAVFSTTKSSASLRKFMDRPQNQKAIVIIHFIEGFLTISLHYNVSHIKAYLWLSLHWMAVVFAKLCVALYRIKESDTSRAFFNTFVSIALLMSLSLVSGELYKTFEFPHLYVRKFHGGCMLSGVFGSIVIISNFKLLDIKSKHEITMMSSCSLIIVSLISLFCFDVILDAATLFSCFVTMATGALHCHLESQDTSNDKHSMDPEEKRPSNSTLLM